MEQKITIQMIDPDDFPRVGPIARFYIDHLDGSSRFSQEQDGLLGTSSRDIHALIGGKKNKGRVWIAEEGNCTGKSAICGVITLQKGPLIMQDIPNPDFVIQSRLMEPALRTTFQRAAAKQPLGIIGNLLTTEDYRKNGISLTLIKAAMNHAIDNDGYPYIGTYVEQDDPNDPFLKAGFRILGQNPREDGTPRYAMGAIAELPKQACAA